MELPFVANAPRELSLGGHTLRARTLTLGDLGEILAWLEDRLPDDPERSGPVLFSSEAAQLALATTEGVGLVLHLSCLSCHPGMSRDEARRLAATMTEAEESRLREIAYRRRPRYGDDTSDGKLRDLAEIRWGEVFDAMSAHDPSQYAAIARLTLDQYDCHCSDGKVPYPGGPVEGDVISMAEMQRRWKAAQERHKAEQAADAGPDVSVETPT